MQLGWVDFSDKDRNKVMDVIRQLSQPDTVDELGIGIIRNAFSDYFFPGTSTVQTRAKYYIIIPFLLKEMGDDSSNSSVEQLLVELPKKEKQCAERLDKNTPQNEDGIIGRDTLPDWVVRSPSDIYWNGIKTFKIFTPYQMSIKSYFNVAIQKSKDRKSKGYDKSENNKGKDADKRSSNEDEDWDDIDAGMLSGLCHWDLNEIYSSGWMKNLSIKLTSKEAEYLKRKIIESQPGTLLSYILENGFNVEDYRDFFSFSKAFIKAVDLPQELVDVIALANDFNKLVVLARIRYNMIYTNYSNAEWNNKWMKFDKNIEKYCNVDIKAIYRKFRLRNLKLYNFLNDLQGAFREKNLDKADLLIKQWEKNNKKRAKLWSDVNSRDMTKWIGGSPSNPYLDYRYGSARIIIRDIQTAEDKKDA